MKGDVSEVILTVGILIAVGIALFLLRPIFFKESQSSQDQPLAEFSSDIETTIYRVVASTNDVSLSYGPLVKKYVFRVSDNIVSVQDKTTGKSVSFFIEGNKISDVCFEDSDKIIVRKEEQKLDIKPENNIGCGGVKLTTTTTSTTTTLPQVCEEKLVSCPANICLSHVGNQKCIDGFNKYYNQIKEAVIVENLQQYTGSVENAVYLVASVIGTETGWNEADYILQRGGLMQVTRSTAESSCNDIGTYEEISAVAVKNFRCGIRVLKNKFSSLDTYASFGYNFKQHGTDNYIKSALAAYNGGAALIFEAVKDTGSTNWDVYGNLDSLTIGARKYDVCITGDPYCESQGYDCYQCEAAVVMTYVNIKAGQYYPVWPQCQKETRCTTTTTSSLQGTCLVKSPTITCGSYNSNYPKCKGGHGSNVYWSGSASAAGRCSYNIGGATGPLDSIDPDGTINVCHKKRAGWKLSQTYGYAIDVSSTGPGAPVFLPSINGKTITWSWTGAELGVPNDLNPMWGYLRIYKGFDDEGNNYEIWLSHLNRGEGNVKNVPSGTQVGTLFNLGEGTHVHIELKVNGENVKPEFLCSEEFSNKFIIGKSVEGREIEVFKFGHGNTKLLVVGGIHGGYEHNGIEIASNVVSYFESNPQQIPDDITLFIIPNMNPDGYSSGIWAPGLTLNEYLSRRLNANNVDLNRNWDCNWDETAYWQDNIVSGGSNPFSEPETRAVRDFLISNNVKGVIFYHSSVAPNGMIFAGYCGNRPSYSAGYPVTGDAIDYLDSVGIAGIEIEFQDHSSVELDRNLNGILSIMNRFSSKDHVDSTELASVVSIATDYPLP